MEELGVYLVSVSALPRVETLVEEVFSTAKPIVVPNDGQAGNWVTRFFGGPDEPLNSNSAVELAKKTQEDEKTEIPPPLCLT